MPAARLGYDVMLMDGEGKLRKTFALRCYPGMRMVFYEFIVSEFPPGPLDSVFSGTLDPVEYESLISRILYLAPTLPETSGSPPSGGELHHILLQNNDGGLLMNITRNLPGDENSTDPLVELVDGSFLSNILTKAH